MDHLSERAVIRYLCLKGMTPTEIHEDMTSTLELFRLWRTTHMSFNATTRAVRRILSDLVERIVATNSLHNLKREDGDICNN